MGWNGRRILTREPMIPLTEQVVSHFSPIDQIEGLGIKPDVELPMTSQQYIDEGDIQVFKAIDILRGVK